VRARQPDVGLVAGAVAGAALLALSSFMLLSKIATPADLSARLTAAGAQVDRAQRLAGGGADPAAYGKGALCSQPAEVAAPAIRSGALAIANAAGLSATDVKALPRRLDFEHGTPSVDLQIRADGRYDAIVQMLGRLSAARPQIFVDTLDLESRTSAVSLKLSGHVFCRTPAAS